MPENKELPFDIQAYEKKLETMTPEEIQRYTTELLTAEDRLEIQTSITSELQTRAAALGEQSADNKERLAKIQQTIKEFAAAYKQNTTDSEGGQSD